MPSAEEEKEERAVFNNEEDDDEDDATDTDGDDSDLEDDDDDDDDMEAAAPPPPPSDPSAANPNSSTPNLNPNPNPNPILSTPAAVENLEIHDARRALVPFDDSRRLFQRLWTDDDEIKILQGFYEFTAQRGTTFASHQYDTGPFYEQIKRQLQLDFTKNQLIEKLRRLKKKFRNAASRIAAGKEFVFKNPHDQAAFEISRKIWSLSLNKRSAESEDGDDPETPRNNTIADNTVVSDRRIRRRRRRRVEETAVEVPVIGVAVENSTATICAPPTNGNVPSLVEETVRSCLGPLFKELLSSAVAMPNGLGHGLGAGGLGMSSLTLLSVGGNPANPSGDLAADVDDKWRKQRIMELEVYLKRVELLQDQIKSTLEELKSSGS